MPLVCPKCSSKAVLSLSLIHREGTSAIDATAKTAGTSGSVAVTAVRGAPEVASGGRVALVRQAAPPSRRLWIPWLFVAIVSAGVALGRVTNHDAVLGVAAGAMLLASALAIRAHSYNARDFPVRYQSWQRSFMCRRCGEVFVSTP